MSFSEKARPCFFNGSLVDSRLEDGRENAIVGQKEKLRSFAVECERTPGKAPWANFQKPPKLRDGNGFEGRQVMLLNTRVILEDLSKVMDKEAAGKITDLVVRIYEDLGQMVTKAELRELTAVVSELAETQREATRSIQALNEAQERTEKRLLELAESHNKLEKRVDALTESVQKLTLAQERTEKRLLELAESQERTEKRVDGLAESMQKLALAQERTERSLNRLSEEHAETRERLESMSDAVGYTLENQSYKSLPALLERDHDIRVEGRLIRRYFPGKRKGQLLQANIYGWGRKNGRKLLILGEAKTSLSRKEIDRFGKLASKIAVHEGVPMEDVFQVVVVHDVTPSVEEHAKDAGLQVYWSYDL